MNTLELKGGMIELIGQVKNRELLQHLYEIISEVLADTVADKTELSAEQESRLDEDIKASKNNKNLIDNEAALKKMDKWLKK
jgi:hypothetical protein